VNTSALKYIGIFVGGVAVGAFVTYQLVKEQFAIISQEEINSVKEYYEKKNEQAEKKAEVTIKQVIDDADIATVGYKRTAYDQAMKKYASANEVVKSSIDISTLSRAQKENVDPVELESPPDDPPEEDEEEENTQRPIDNGAEPYIISVESFNEENTHYDKISITYYDDDDVLVDDDETVIANVNEVVGSKALTSFGQLSDDPQIVYVRNDRYGIDYEIIRNFGNYQATVLGIANAKSAAKKMRKETDDSKT
jgi:hypothetical protein